MGISNVMSAKKILLVASGENKASAIQATVMGPVTENVPASVQQNHPDVIIIVDEEAAALLPERIPGISITHK
jgi:glucosamine-6-phosphate deaminase